MAENLIAGANPEYNIEGRGIHVMASYSDPKKKENTMCLYFDVFMFNQELQRFLTKLRLAPQISYNFNQFPDFSNIFKNAFGAYFAL